MYVGKHESGFVKSKNKGLHEVPPSFAKRFTPTVRAVFALFLCVLIPAAAFADTWDLTQGSVDIGFQNDVQYVTQSSTSVADANPVITSNGVATENTITVSSGEGQTAQFTVQDVVITVDQNTSIGTETLIGGNTVKEGASVSVDGSSQISVWSGTMDKSNISDADRNCYKDAMKGGSIKAISMTAESLASIIKGVEINLMAVPKMIVNAVTADDFWENVKAQIAATEKGGKLIVDVGNRLYIPMRIIEFAQECQVTLVIVWDGGEDIEIRPDHSIESSFDTISIASLPELLKK